MIFSLEISLHFLLQFTYKFCIPIKLIFTCSSFFLNIFERTFSLLAISAIIFIMVSSEIDIWGFLLNFGILDEPPCYVRQCSLMLSIVLNFFKCLGFHMHYISLYGALSLHNCSSSGSLVFALLGSINKIAH